jgi:hypothetical protein
MHDDSELAATEAINAELAQGFGPLSVQECKVRYGAAFKALVARLRQPERQ